ncbi:hypothetical protein FB451DRAFT_1192089 [Mycena latifolia]|nr:hypothetical protein FB451DRAFT_1192089 [Mycena latifolia]
MFVRLVGGRHCPSRIKESTRAHNYTTSTFSFACGRAKEQNGKIRHWQMKVKEVESLATRREGFDGIKCMAGPTFRVIANFCSSLRTCFSSTIEITVLASVITEKKIILESKLESVGYWYG